MRSEERRIRSEELYRRGNEFRKQGNWQEAINCYIEAAELDPDSPAVEAKAMLDEILNFYNKDAYNP
ncbi:MAG: tetratricopeptide repeat protein [Prevotella sp.]